MFVSKWFVYKQTCVYCRVLTQYSYWPKESETSYILNIIYKTNSFKFLYNFEFSFFPPAIYVLKLLIKWKDNYYIIIIAMQVLLLRGIFCLHAKYKTNIIWWYFLHNVYIMLKLIQIQLLLFYANYYNDIRNQDFIPFFYISIIEM